MHRLGVAASRGANGGWPDTGPSRRCHNGGRSAGPHASHRLGIDTGRGGGLFEGGHSERCTTHYFRA